MVRRDLIEEQRRWKSKDKRLGKKKKELEHVVTLPSWPSLFLFGCCSLAFFFPLFSALLDILEQDVLCRQSCEARTRGEKIESKNRETARF